MVEFGLVMAIFMICLPVMIDFVNSINASIRLSGAIRVGQQYAMLHPSDTSGIETAVKSATNLTASNLTVTTTEACECSGVSAYCGVACSGGASQAKYLTISTQYQMSSSFGERYFGGNPYNINKQITIRPQ